MPLRAAVHDAVEDHLRLPAVDPIIVPERRTDVAVVNGFVILSGFQDVNGAPIDQGEDGNLRSI